MGPSPHIPDDCIRQALADVAALMQQAFAEVGGVPELDSVLDQCGLRNGDKIVLDYLQHGESGLALEHLIYMIEEPSLPTSDETYRLIERAGRAMKMDTQLWESLR